jgi:fructan beta-fructosidase
VTELSTLREDHASLDGQSIAAANRALNAKRVRGDTLEILAEIDGGSAAEVGLRVRKGIDEGTTIGVDCVKREVFVDRTRSEDTAFDERLAGRHVGPIRQAGGKQVKLHIFVDRSSVEVFVNDGSTVISDCIFPSSDSKDLELYSRMEKLES